MYATSSLLNFGALVSEGLEYPCTAGDSMYKATESRPGATIY